MLLNEAQHLAEQFNQLAGWLDGVRGQVASDIRSSVGEINRLSDAIANMNESYKLRYS